jgi:RNA polymerase sigma-70 factor, ECF subfamily
MDKDEEHKLIRAAQGGDASAFEALVNMHYETIFKMAFKWCGNKTDAEDITQEACIKLARGIGAFRFESAFTSWLYTLVINTAKDWYKKANRQPSSDGLETAQVSAKSEDRVYAREVLAEIYKLPDGEKEALLLVMGKGLSHREAGKVLGCKESTVSWRIHEARKKLGALLGKEQKYG